MLIPLPLLSLQKRKEAPVVGGEEDFAVMCAMKCMFGGDAATASSQEPG